MTLWHKNLRQRFSGFTSCYQILMICNELNRAHNNVNDRGEYTRSIEKALELMDFLIDGGKWNPKMREIVRARNIIS